MSQSSRALAGVSEPPGLFGGALLLAWPLLAGPVLPGLATARLEAEARPQLLLVTTLLALAGRSRRRQVDWGDEGPSRDEPRWTGPALSLGLLLQLVLSALALSLGRFLLWPAALLGLPLCSGWSALLGLYRPPSRFRRGLPLLLLEGGAAHVDLPCSGLRSLWTGRCFSSALAASGAPAWICAGWAAWGFCSSPSSTSTRRGC